MRERGREKERERDRDVDREDFHNLTIGFKG